MQTKNWDENKVSKKPDQNKVSKNPDQVTISFHAAQRIRQMNLDYHEVIRTVLNPDMKYPGRPSHSGLPTQIRVRGRLAVVCSLDNVVVTILWHRADTRSAA